jgi:hypothetical protein
MDYETYRQNYFVELAPEPLFNYAGIKVWHFIMRRMKRLLIITGMVNGRQTS